MTRGLAALGSALALAVTATWVLSGAHVSSPESGQVATNPWSLVLHFISAKKMGVVSSAAVWSVALDVVLAAGLGLLLTVRARRSVHAVRLGLALGCLSAGGSLLFIACLFLPLDGWIATALPDRTSLAFAVVATLAWAGTGFFLLGAGVWILARFWMEYPTAVDANALLELVRQRHVAAQQDGKRLLGRWFPADEGSGARAAERCALLADTAKLHKSALAHSIVRKCAGAAGVWTLASVLAGVFRLDVVPGFAALFIGGLALAVAAGAFAAPLSSIAEVIAFHVDVESGAHRRRIEWVQVVGIWGRLVINASLPLTAVATVGVILLAPFLMLLNPTSMEFVSATRPIETLMLISWVLPFTVLPGLLVLALGAAIFGRGLVDPRLALKKASLWTLLGLAIAIVFVLVERFVALELVRWLALPAESGAIIASVAVAVTFVPIRHAVETWVNRFVEKRMPARLLAAGDAHVGAVAVVDISGFTALSAHDEPAALLATTLLQREARRICDTNDGRVVKSTGDGAMLVFDDANDAARTLRELHAAFGRGLEALSLPPLTLHSGAHWGEYVDVRGTDIYGQTVNVASRLADAATSGEVLVSNAFAKALDPQEPAPAPVGARHFKNVPDPVECLRLAI